MNFKKDYKIPEHLRERGGLPRSQDERRYKVAREMPWRPPCDMPQAKYSCDTLHAPFLKRLPFLVVTWLLIPYLSVP